MQERVIVERVIVEIGGQARGAGHAWFGGDSSGSYADAKGPNALAEMLWFFSLHERKDGN
jgi:hypothetical protein